jgi:RimJ/RimL family protein N-acetyltransferase
MDHPSIHIETERLRLRDWSDADAEPFAAMNADRCVMAFFPALLEREQSDELMARIRSNMARDGFGLYAVEERRTSLFIGFTGLAVATFAAPFTPATEIGWRLSRQAWGKGYASEAAAAVRDHAFEALGLAELVSFTSQQNYRSRRVMEKIGMTCDPADDFIHPGLPSGHELAPHVLYRILSGAVSN